MAKAHLSSVQKAIVDLQTQRENVDAENITNLLSI